MTDTIGGKPLVAVKVEEISIEEYKTHVINSIKKKYPTLRQLSKAP